MRLMKTSCVMCKSPRHFAGRRLAVREVEPNPLQLNLVQQLYRRDQNHYTHIENVSGNYFLNKRVMITRLVTRK